MSALGSPRLVFGDDGSPGADVAWLWINEHRWPGWRLEIVTATGVALGEPHPWTAPVPCRRPFAEADFDSHLSRRPEQDPRLALCADGELLVIGDRGRGVLKALHLGSTTEWLAVRPPMPMIIARHGRPTRTVVLATDGSGDARAATEALAMLPLTDSVRLTVAVVDDGTIAEVDPVIDEAVAALRGLDAALVPTVLRGSDELSRLVASTNADLVACGTRGRRNRESGRLGTTARQLVHNRDVSVLLTHRRAEQPADARPTAVGARTH
jgi:nucleotide-binding universal stress UspA family protein